MINLSCPINPLSFGNVSVNFIRSIHSKNIPIAYFPIGKDLDFKSFDKLDPEIPKYLTKSYNSRYDNLDQNNPSLRIWHLSGSEMRVGSKQFLYSFYELDEPTKEEISIARNQTATIFSSRHACDLFSEHSDNCHYVPLGFDPDLFNTGKTYLKNKIHFGLMGKIEKRKHTLKIIKLWAEKYGNNPDYQLTCLINNPFLKREQVASDISKALGSETYKNINFLPFLNKNSEVNELLNSINIDLTGLSGAEGWNLPAFNATCLGKWSVVLNSTSHKDWANQSNSILVEPSGKIDAYDDVFFKKNSPFNQGKINDFSKDSFIDAMETAVEKCSSENINGIKLKDKFTYESSINQILKIIKHEP